MRIVSFILGLLFDEAATFVHEKTDVLKYKIKRHLRKIHAYLISCFSLMFLGTVFLAAFIIKLGINLDQGVMWSNALTVYILFSLGSFGLLYSVMKEKHEYNYEEDSEYKTENKINEIIDEILAEKMMMKSGPSLTKSRKRKKPRRRV